MSDKTLQSVKITKIEHDKDDVFAYSAIAGTFFAICCLAAIVMLPEGKNTSRSTLPSETRNTANQRFISNRPSSIGFKLATIERGARVDPDDRSISEFDALVSQIADATGSSPERIADYCVGAQRALSRNGHEATLLTLMKKAAYLSDPELKVRAEEIFALIVTTW